MTSNHRLWARFRSENDGMTQISIVPVLFWETEGEGQYHKAYVLIPPGTQMEGYAIPFDESDIVNYLGRLEGFILHDNIQEEITRLNKWVEKDEDNSLYVYPKI